MRLLADEKVILLASFALAAYCHFGARDPRARRYGDRIAASAVVAAALPHLIKRFVDRERPDRRVVHGPRHGVPRSGERNGDGPLQQTSLGAERR